MPYTQKRWLALVPVCAIWLALLAACASPPTPEVGQVVVAPRRKLPETPARVRETAPKPPGYFQDSLLGYFSSSPLTPTR